MDKSRVRSRDFRAVNLGFFLKRASSTGSRNARRLLIIV
jgi:hypothetical protein